MHTLTLILIISTVLCVLSSIASYYTGYRLVKRFEMIDGVNDFMVGMVMLSSAWWFLDRFASGMDSSIGWWLLAALSGTVISNLLNSAVRFLCGRIWPKDSDTFITTVKVPDAMRMILDIFVLAVSLGFAVLFICILFSSSTSGFANWVLTLLCAILMVYGSIDRLRRIIRRRRR